MNSHNTSVYGYQHSRYTLIHQKMCKFIIIIIITIIIIRCYIMSEDDDQGPPTCSVYVDCNSSTSDTSLNIQL